MEYKKASFWVSLLAVVAVAAIIFMFSAQDAPQSSSTSGKIVKVVLNIFVPDFDSLSAAEQAKTLSTVSFIVRKLAHFSEFALLGFVLLLHTTIGKYKYRIVLSAVIGVLYAASDEIHQMFVGGRAPQIGDVLIDCAGVVCGILFSLLIIFIIGKIRKKKTT